MELGLGVPIRIDRGRILAGQFPGYNSRIRPRRWFLSQWVLVRSPLVTVFDDTLGFCFESALKDMLGLGVRDSVYALLERSGIPRREVASRFDEAVGVLLKVLGEPSRVLVHRTLVELCGQYSRRVDFSYEDSLRDCLLLLRDEVVSSHLVPRRLHESSGLDEYWQNQSRASGMFD